MITGRCAAAKRIQFRIGVADEIVRFPEAVFGLRNRAERHWRRPTGGPAREKFG